MRGFGAGVPAPACGPRVRFSRAPLADPLFAPAFAPPLAPPLAPPPLAPAPPFAPAPPLPPLPPFVSFVAIGLSPRVSRSAGARDRVAALHADALLAPALLPLGRILVDLGPHARRRAGLGIEQHDVRRRHRGRHLDDPALLLGRTRAAVPLHDVDPLDEHPARLRVDAHHLPLAPLVVTAHHANRVALLHVHRRPR